MTTTTPPEHLTIDQLYDWYRVQTPDKPCLLYLGVNGSKEVISMLDYGKAIYRSIDIIRSEIPEHRDGHPTEKPLTIAFLSNSDWPTYTAFFFGHAHLTHPRVGRPVLPFLISPRNSAIAIAHLLKETQCSYIWATEGPMASLAEEAIAINIDMANFKTQLKKFPSFNELYYIEPTSIPACYDDSHVPPSTPLTILHSSGSTSFPKTRHFTHEMLFQWGLFMCSTTHHQLEDEIFAALPPPFHAMGIFLPAVAIRNKLILAVNSPYIPPGSSSSDAYLDLMKKTNASYALTIPSFIEEWSEDPVAVEFLKRFKVIIYGGGMINGEIGQKLFKEGVSLRVLYGATEFGTVNNPFEEAIPEGHEWFRFRLNCDKVLVPSDANDIFQIIIKQSKVQTLIAHNTEVDGIRAFDTNDIAQRHPVNHNLYRIVGRVDDQIVLSTGEKTNPGPLEKIIRLNPHVHDVVYFGRGRATNGILVQPKSFEKAEELGIPGFRNLIWQSIEEANAYAPAHSRILKEMILIASSTKPFLYTAKETLKKGTVLDAYKEEIEELYKESVNSVRAEVPIPLGTHPDGGWTESESSKFVHQVIHLIMEDRSKNMGDDDDIFAFGCDSLLATYIRNTLVNGLRQVAPPSNIQKLSTNFVYQSPTINQLSKVLAQTSRFELFSDEPESLEARNQRLEIVIKRYTQNWPSRNPEKEMRQDEEVVLLTGTTGALGSQLLVQLIDLPTVKKIYAVNRPTGQSLHDRHVSTFTDREIDLKLLESEKIVFVEGEVSVPGFGVDPRLYEEMRVSVTCIIHNAWRVHFKISLASYESAIRGVRLLVDFALSSPFIEPPKLLFTSSIGNIKPWVVHQPVPESPFLNIDQINTMGYAESKWISERILTVAGDETALKPVIVRVGQMTGGDAGDWKASEWFPTLVAASQRINSLPSFDGTAAYLLLPSAASAMLELRQASIRFAHLVDPQPALFNDLINLISENLGLPIIPYSDWLKRLEEFCQADNTDGNLNLAEDLLNTYKASAPPADLDIAHSRKFEAMGWAVFETTETTEAAPSLRDTPVLGKLQVERWLAYWRKKQILS